MKRRVVVTGIGVLTPIGNGIDKFYKSLREGKSGVSKLDDSMIVDGCASKLGGRIFDFKPENYMTEKSARRMDRFAQFGVAACKMALDDARLDPKECDNGEGLSVYMGTAVGGFPYGEQQHGKYLERGLRKVDPLLSSRVFYGCGVNVICIELGIKGIVHGVTSGCAASSDAIGDAYNLIKSGKSDVALAGGADAPFAPLTFSSFYLIGVMSTRSENTPSPYDAKRDGIVISEGAGVLVLEERNRALKRGVKIYGEVIGYGTTHDAYHVTKPAPDGKQIARAIKIAIKDAKIDKEAIDHIASHGCGTTISDTIETNVIKEVFGDYSKKMTISAIESMIGHPLSSVGVLKSASALLSIIHGVAFPTINYKTKDPECDLDYVVNKPRNKNVQVAMVNALSFGGKNSALIFRKHSEDD